MFGFLIFILVIVIFWPWISAWLRGFIARRAEDMLRRMAGMPPRKGGRNMHDRRGTDYAKEYEHRREREEAIRDMKAYAEDAEYVETKEFTPSEKQKDQSKHLDSESQVSDAEYTLIK